MDFETFIDAEHMAFKPKTKRPWSDDMFDHVVVPVDHLEKMGMSSACYGKGGGGSAPAPSSQTVNQTNLPEYAEPYYTRLMDRAEAVSNQPYVPYGGPRIAEFSPTEQYGFDMTRDIALSGTPGQIGQASNLLSREGNYGLTGLDVNSMYGGRADFDSGYSPSSFGFDYTPGDFAAGYTPGTFAHGYQAPAGFESGYVPREFASGYGDYASFSSGYGGPQTFDFGYQSPDQATYDTQYDARDFDAGQWNEEAAQQYMNPYVEQVLDRLVRRQGERWQEQQAGRSADATAAGAYGTSRYQIAEEVARRDMNERLDDIEAQALADAYNQAGRLWTSDMQRSLQAQGMGERSAAQEEAYRLQGLGMFDASRGLASQFAAQQAQLGEATRRAAADYALSEQGLTEQSRQFMANTALQEQALSEASSRYGGQFNLQEQAMMDAANQALAGYNLQQQTLSDRAAQQAGMFALQEQQYADQANQAYANYQFQQQAMEEQSRLQDAQLQLQEQLAADASLSEADRNQISARIAELQAEQQAAALRMQSAGMLGDLGAMEQGLALDRANAMVNVGGMERGLEQAYMDLGYQDFMNQQDFERQQLNYLSALLHGIPYAPSSTITQYTPPPNPLNSLLGLGLGGYSMYNAFNQG